MNDKPNAAWLDEISLLVSHLSKAVMRSRLPNTVNEQQLGTALLLYAVVTLRSDGCPLEVLVHLTKSFYEKAVRVSADQGGEA